MTSLLTMTLITGRGVHGIVQTIGNVCSGHITFEISGVFINLVTLVDTLCLMRFLDTNTACMSVQVIETDKHEIKF